MGELVIVVLVVVVFLIVKGLSSLGSGGGGGNSTYAYLVRKGLPARGILLAVSSTPSGTVGVAPLRYQMRFVTMDIEIPGRAPYVAQVTPLIPTNLVRDILPGASVELRVHPRQPMQMAVIGPGVGFNGALLNAGGMQQ